MLLFCAEMRHYFSIGRVKDIVKQTMSTRYLHTSTFVTYVCYVGFAKLLKKKKNVPPLLK